MGPKVRGPEAAQAQGPIPALLARVPSPRLGRADAATPEGGGSLAFADLPGGPEDAGKTTQTWGRPEAPCGQSFLLSPREAVTERPARPVRAFPGNQARACAGAVSSRGGPRGVDRRRAGVQVEVAGLMDSGVSEPTLQGQDSFPCHLTSLSSGLCPEPPPRPTPCPSQPPPGETLATRCPSWRLACWSLGKGVPSTGTTEPPIAAQDVPGPGEGSRMQWPLCVPTRGLCGHHGRACALEPGDAGSGGLHPASAPATQTPFRADAWVPAHCCSAPGAQGGKTLTAPRVPISVRWAGNRFLTDQKASLTQSTGSHLPQPPCR